MAKILLVDDEPDFHDLVKAALEVHGHIIDVVTTGADAIQMLEIYEFDLVILDWMLPDQTGVDVCRTYRSRGGQTPILMLTVKAHILHKLEGFEAGVDDYLTKPFHVKELTARVTSLLRRPPMLIGKIFTVGDLRLDTNTRKVFVNGQEVRLLPREFALLEFLMRNPNQIFSKDRLVDSVWPSDSDVSPESVRTYIKRLRNKIESVAESEVLRNVHGVGYMLCA